MTLLQVLILGAVQGLTEFLPVSSDGHLAVFRHLFRVPPENALALDVALHLGTLGSMLVFFRQDLAGLWDGFRASAPEGERMAARRRLALIVLATLVTGVVGLALKAKVEMVNSFMPAVGLGFLLTVLFLMLGEWGATSRLTYSPSEIPLWHGAVIGLVQGLAVWPGFSRSGATIGLALLIGWRWEDAGRTSFLMALPAIAGALLLTARDMTSLPNPGLVGAGILASFVVGLAALTILMRFLSARRLWPFAIYCAALALYSFT